MKEKTKNFNKIAVVGSGISGLACAWLLSLKYDVDLFEANNYFGGHTNTVEIKVNNRDFMVDTGFMVCNFRTYPNLIQMFHYLNVDLQKSNMSFSVHCNQERLEWSGSNLNTVFAQRSNIYKPRFLRMLYDIWRLSRRADDLINDPGTIDITLGDLLDREGFSQSFRDWFLIPMGAAIWSTPPENMLEFPAQTFLKFCDNHGLLKLRQKPQWYTVQGGAKRYVEKLTSQISGKIHQNYRVEKVKKLNPGVGIIIKGKNHTYRYDAAILACHADDSLKILDKPSTVEIEILENFAYQHSDTYLHTDTSFLPENQRVLASWNYWADKCNEGSGLSVTYNLNTLQRLNCLTPVLVTLNPPHDLDKSTIIERFDYAHPLFTKESILAQNKINNIQGEGDIWYAGAWQRYGFHEDGLLSAINVARDFGITPPWSNTGKVE